MLFIVSLGDAAAIEDIAICIEVERAGQRVLEGVDVLQFFHNGIGGGMDADGVGIAEQGELGGFELEDLVDDTLFQQFRLGNGLFGVRIDVPDDALNAAIEGDGIKAPASRGGHVGADSAPQLSEHLVNTPERHPRNDDHDNNLPDEGIHQAFHQG